MSSPRRNDCFHRCGMYWTCTSLLTNVTHRQFGANLSSDLKVWWLIIDVFSGTNTFLHNYSAKDVSCVMYTKTWCHGKTVSPNKGPLCNNLFFVENINKLSKPCDLQRLNAHVTSLLYHESTILPAIDFETLSFVFRLVPKVPKKGREQYQPLGNRCLIYKVGGNNSSAVPQLQLKQ